MYSTLTGKVRNPIGKYMQLKQGIYKNADIQKDCYIETLLYSANVLSLVTLLFSSYTSKNKIKHGLLQLYICYSQVSNKRPPAAYLIYQQFATKLPKIVAQLLIISRIIAYCQSENSSVISPLHQQIHFRYTNTTYVGPYQNHCHVISKITQLS